MPATRSNDSGNIGINTTQATPGIKATATPANPNNPRRPIKAGVPDFLRYAVVPTRKKLSIIITTPI